MADKDFPLLPNNHDVNTFMQDLPFQQGTSLSHDFLDSVSYVQNRDPSDTIVMQPSFSPPWYLHQHGQSSRSGRLNQVEEYLESAMGRLSLFNNPDINIASHVGKYGYGIEALMEEAAVFEGQLKLQDLRVRAAAAAAARSHSLQRRNLSSLEGVRGYVVSMAKDQCGCRFLQMKIDEGRPQDIEMILSEVKGHWHELMKHHYGNYLIQKIFESSSGSVNQMNCVLRLTLRNHHKLKDVCMNNQGTRVIQKMLENLKTDEQKHEVTYTILKITVPLMKNVNGGYVIQQLVKLFPAKYQNVILDEVALNCIDISTDQSGCSVIQNCLSHAKGEAIMILLVDIILNAAILAEDQFGNYVVQFLIKMKMPLVNTQIISQLRGKYVGLSMNKHASHVVECLLQVSEEDHTALIVEEIMNSRDLLNVLQDPYGNFVAQGILNYAKGALHRKFLNRILSYYRYLQSDLYGKNVLACAKKSMVNLVL